MENDLINLSLINFSALHIIHYAKNKLWHDMSEPVGGTAQFNKLTLKIKLIIKEKTN